jgi:hypothetical protein
MEMLLLNGMKAHFFLPQPLPYGERERLKKYIDLVLEETPPRPVNSNRVTDQIVDSDSE